MGKIMKDSYRIELFTNSVEAQQLRKWLKPHKDSDEPEWDIKHMEHARFGGSIFLIVAPSTFRKVIFEKWGQEKWFAMEGSIVRNVNTWDVEES